MRQRDAAADWFSAWISGRFGVVSDPPLRTELSVANCGIVRKRVEMDEFDERLAEEVRKHRRLYDNACPSRKNSKATTATWKAIGNAVDEDPTVCMRRWKALRDKFVRLKKRIKTKVVPPGSEGAKVHVHVIHEKLSWLNEHVTHRAIANKREVRWCLGFIVYIVYIVYITNRPASLFVSGFRTQRTDPPTLLF